MDIIRETGSMVRLTSVALAFLMVAALSSAEVRKNPVPHHARGTFTVIVQPVTPAPAEGLSRFSINKQMHGDLEGDTKGEMFSGGDPKQGMAGYVAIEVFTGTLFGKHGSFALQHFATMDQSGRKMSVVMVPGSGSGDLRGIAGTFDIQIANGVHSYELEYSLPD